MTANERAQLIYDGECDFCTASARWIGGRGDAFDVTPWQSIPDLNALGLTEDDVTTAAYWVDPDGRKARGAEAIGRALQARTGILRAVGRVILARPILPVAHVVYRRIANNRHRLPGIFGACGTDRES